MFASRYTYACPRWFEKSANALVHVRVLRRLLTQRHNRRIVHIDEKIARSDVITKTKKKKTQ